MTDPDVRPVPHRLGRIPVGFIVLATAIIGALLWLRLAPALAIPAAPEYANRAERPGVARGHGAEGTGSAPTAPSVMGALVAHQNRYRVARPFLGRVEAPRKSPLGFEVSGTVVDVRVNEGDIIEPGDPIASLDDSLLRTRRAELLAERDAMRSQVRLARKNQKRFAVMVKRDSASKARFDEALERAETLTAQLQLAEARLESNQASLNKLTIVAPFGGVVSARWVDEGAVVQPGQHIAELIERGSREARVGIAGDSLSLVQLGARYPISAGEHRLVGLVKAILPKREPRARTVDIILRLEADPSGEANTLDPASLSDGDPIRLSLVETIEQAGFWTPLSALKPGPRGLWSILIINGEQEPRADGAGDADNPAGLAQLGHLERRLVEIIATDGERAFVRGPLSDGATFVADGLHRVVPGQRVRVASPRNDRWQTPTTLATAD